MIGIYAYNLPLVIAFIWKKHRFAAGFGAFYPGSAIRRAEKQLGRKGARKNTKKMRVRRAADICAGLIGHIRMEYFSARLLVGAGDAARTAEICGALTALGNALRAHARAGRVDIRPDFSGRTLEGEVKAVIALRAGDVARAAVKHALGR